MISLLNIHSSAEAISAQRLSDQCPKEIGYFCRRFIWSSNRTGFYTRERYFSSDDRPAWQPHKRRGGEWQYLYPDLVADLVEKHLDFERFCRIPNLKSQVRPQEHQTAFWLGTMAGKESWGNCIDVDSHEVIGCYGIPSRWHVDRNRHNPLYVQLIGDNPYEYRFLPVVRLSLDHFRRLKRFHDHFPNRIWAFSSANLGLGLWQMYSHEIKTAHCYDVIEAKLEAAGLGGTEHYPRPPKKEESKGKVHRRPCGMDSGIITEQGVVTDPIEQIGLFMEPPPAPSFNAVCTAIFAKLSEMYTGWLAWDGFDTKNDIPKDQRPAKVAELVAELDQVRDWINSGCPQPKIVVAVPELPAAKKKRKQKPSQPCGLAGLVVDQEDREQGHAPDMFRSVDLRAIDDSGQWVQFCVFLVQHGFPCHDRFFEVVSTLTFWLAFYELHHLWPDRTKIKEVLKTFCLKKHNGFITRMATGQVEEVLAHVERVVDEAIESVSLEGKQVFASMRIKRDTGCYASVYRLVPYLLAENESDIGITLCGGLIPDSADKKWSYVPDNTPLPDQLLTRIKDGFRAAKRQLRQDKSGEYPTLQAITRLINYIYAGKNPGHRRASQQLFVLMGFPDKTANRQRLKKIVFKTGVMYEGEYEAQRRSRLYCLSKEVIAMLDEERQVGRAIA